MAGGVAITWANPGTNGDWNTAAAWSGDAVPTTADDATLGASSSGYGGYAVDLGSPGSSAAGAANSLEIDGARNNDTVLGLLNGSLSIATSMNFNSYSAIVGYAGVNQISFETLTGGGNIGVAPGAILTLATHDVSGSITLSAGGGMDITNGASLTVTGGGSLTMSQSALAFDGANASFADTDTAQTNVNIGVIQSFGAYGANSFSVKALGAGDTVTYGSNTITIHNGDTVGQTFTFAGGLAANAIGFQDVGGVDTFTAPVTWANPGTSGDWNVAASWRGGAVPTAGFDVKLGASTTGGYTVNLGSSGSSAPGAANTLEIDGATNNYTILGLSNDSLSVGTSITLDSYSVILGYAGVNQISFETLTGSGNVGVASGAKLTLTTHDASGSITLSAGRGVDITTGASLTVTGGGTLSMSQAALSFDGANASFVDTDTAQTNVDIGVLQYFGFYGASSFSVKALGAGDTVTYGSDSRGFAITIHNGAAVGQTFTFAGGVAANGIGFQDVGGVDTFTAPVTWANPGTNGDWNVAASWSRGTAPSAGDNVKLGASTSGNYAVGLGSPGSPAAGAAKTLEIDGATNHDTALNLSNDSLSVGTNITLDSYSAIVGSAGVNQISFETLTGGGNVVVQTDAKLTLTTHDVSGSIALSASGGMVMSAGASLVVTGGGTLDMSQSALTFEGANASFADTDTAQTNVDISALQHFGAYGSNSFSVKALGAGDTVTYGSNSQGFDTVTIHHGVSIGQTFAFSGGVAAASIGFQDVGGIDTFTAPITWANPGTSGDWNVAASWRGNAVPTAGDYADLVASTTGNYTVNLGSPGSSAAGAVKALEIDGATNNFTILGFSNDSLSVGTSITLASYSAIVGYAGVNQISFETLTGGGNVAVETGATLTLATHDAAGSIALTNAGFDLSAAATLTVTGGATLHVSDLLFEGANASFVDIDTAQGNVQIGTILGFGGFGGNSLAVKALNVGDTLSYGANSVTIHNGAAAGQTFAFGAGTNINAINLQDVGGVDILTICFMAGTQVRTPEGEVAIETLRRGNLVLTAEGAAKPVTWLGRQTVSTVFADPLRILPIRIRAGALADNVPARDLLVSPDHALRVEDILVQAGALVNGTSITRETDVPQVFVYYHVELDDHSLILAENVPAETFVDNVDRMNFDNWAEHEALYPAGKPIVEMAYPRAKAFRQVPRRIREDIAARGAGLGSAAIAA